MNKIIISTRIYSSLSHEHRVVITIIMAIIIIHSAITTIKYKHNK